jgi:carboxylesterase type B
MQAYGGTEGPVPFRRAISQSPGFVPTRSNNYTNTTFQDFLRYANATSLADLRNASTETLLLANAHQVWDTAVFGSGTYGPVVDGTFVPDLPGILLKNGSFDQNVEIIVGQNLNEGSYFTSPFIREDQDVVDLLTMLFGEDQMSAYEYVVTDLYPANYNGSQPYRNWYERAQLIVSEFGFICNAYYMASANPNNTYGYQFVLFPGYHGQDLQYTFYADTPVNGSAANLQGLQNASVAYTLQDWIVNFAREGVPTSNVALSVDLPLYAENATVGALYYVPPTGSISTIKKDPANNERCRWWQEALYAPSS